MCLASMGIYTFRPQVLSDLLDGTAATDFGYEVIPSAVHDLRIFAFGYPGYWRDIGTIPAFHRANLELTQPVPPMDLYSSETPIYTHPRFLPATKVSNCEVSHALLGEGSVLSGAKISRSVIGIRTLVSSGTTIEDSVVMGANTYEWASGGEDAPRIGIGRDCTIRRSIIDLDARIGNGVKLVNAAGIEEDDKENYSIRGGIIVVPGGATIPSGTVI